MLSPANDDNTLMASVHSAPGQSLPRTTNGLLTGSENNGSITPRDWTVSKDAGVVPIVPESFTNRVQHITPVRIFVVPFNSAF